MLRSTIPLDQLIAYLFGADSLLAAEVGPCLVASPRFRAFAEVYRDKIRKKARGLRDDESRRDLAFELAIALRLLEERRFAVEYESYGVGQRAPDFRATPCRRILRERSVSRRLEKEDDRRSAVSKTPPAVR